MISEGSQKDLGPVKNIGYLDKLIDEGYRVNGPRQDAAKDLISLKAFLRKRREFIREDWLSNNGYQFVEASNFTKGRRLAYKMIEGFPDEHFKSNYSLLKGDREIPLYLKVEVKMEQG